MKKVFLIIVVLVMIVSLNNKKDELIIPKEAIRFRVIANSNSRIDQDIKLLIRDKIQTKMVSDLVKVESIEEARETIQENTTSYDKLVASTLEENHIQEEYQLKYGMNYFPEKVYKGVKYEEGYYESLVVTLGNGLGDNWWCVLFPPLCLLEAEETEETTEVEYKFFISELIDKYLK